MSKPLLQNALRWDEWYKIMHWNGMNDIEHVFFKFLKSKLRRGGQIIQSFCRIGSLQGARSPLFIFRTFWKTEKKSAEPCSKHFVLMVDLECKSFKFYNSSVLQNWFHPKISSPLVTLKKFLKTEKDSGIYWNLIAMM